MINSKFAQLTPLANTNLGKTRENSIVLVGFYTIFWKRTI